MTVEEVRGIHGARGVSLVCLAQADCAHKARKRFQGTAQHACLSGMLGRLSGEL